jgi:6-pyruvoyltetrahydropterin/6-carboxytetrahydropterin synthase
MKVYCTFKAHFNAGHRLHNPALDEDTNRRIYGKCNNPHGHGHNYSVEVTLAGEPDPELGRFVNIEEVAAWFDREVIAHMDHRNLNIEVPFLEGIIPTAENIARVLCERLLAGPYGNHLYELRLLESENNAARVRVADLH